VRTAFIEALCCLAAHDERIWLLTGDLGYSVLERFADRFPKRYVNVGVAEQNMTGLAAGLAHEGKIVFTYSIANFPVIRCLEQIRNDVCYHDLNVKVVAVGGGVAYGSQGYTHHGIEDLAVMRAMPNMTVVAPGDPMEARRATEAIAAHPGPCYLRLGKAGEPAVHADGVSFQLGKAVFVRNGTDVALFSTGAILKEVADAGELLARAGISSAVISMHTLKPIDIEAIQRASQTKAFVTVEEHSRIGGLRSAVCEAGADLPGGLPPVLSFGIDEDTLYSVGSQAHLRRKCGLAAEQLADAIRDRLSHAD